MKKFLIDNQIALICLAIIGVMLYFLSGCSGERAQAGSNARAGLQASAQAIDAGDAGKAKAIIAGVDAYLPAATGVNSTQWPQPQMTPTAIVADPVAYTKAAPPEPPKHWYAAISAGAVLAGVALVLRFGKELPGIAGVSVRIADMLWHQFAPFEAKVADEKAHTLMETVDAVANAKPT